MGQTGHKNCNSGEMMTTDLSNPFTVYESEEDRNHNILNSQTICADCLRGISLTKCVLVGVLVLCPECAKKQSTYKEDINGTDSIR